MTVERIRLNKRRQMQGISLLSGLLQRACFGPPHLARQRAPTYNKSRRTAPAGPPQQAPETWDKETSS